MPPNPAILVPGPALIFVVVNGVPSTGQWVMIGNGQMGDQPILATAELPASSGGDGGAWNSGNLAQTQTVSGSNAKQTGASGSKSKDTSAAGRVSTTVLALALTAIGAAVTLF